MKKAFTLVELLVVIAMLALLTGSVSSAVVKARRRANIERATAVAQELTNALLAYENYATDGKLPTMDRQPADRTSIGIVLGDAPKGENGDVPVLFNATLSGSKQELLDPWGRPYYVTIRPTTIQVDADDLVKQLKSGLSTGVFFPNYWRRHAGEE